VASESRSILPRIRILLVDDHSLICEGLTVLLEGRTGMTIVGTAATGTEAISTAARLKPDLIVMDLMLPDMNGIEATQRIVDQLPLTRIIALSASGTSEHVYRAIRAGARGYLLKNGISSELLSAIETVHAGKHYLSPGIDPLILARALSKSPRETPMERLSKRERDVMRWIVAGSTSAEIGIHMALSRKTIDTYRSRLMVKLGVVNRSALIRLAIEHEPMGAISTLRDK
jgi:DNA-binding NarL/FixJ family response regulator